MFAARCALPVTSGLSWVEITQCLSVLRSQIHFDSGPTSACRPILPLPRSRACSCQERISASIATCPRGPQTDPAQRRLIPHHPRSSSMRIARSTRSWHRIPTPPPPLPSAVPVLFAPLPVPMYRSCQFAASPRADASLQLAMSLPHVPQPGEEIPQTLPQTFALSALCGPGNGHRIHRKMGRVRREEATHPSRTQTQPEAPEWVRVVACRLQADPVDPNTDDAGRALRERSESISLSDLQTCDCTRGRAKP